MIEVAIAMMIVGAEEIVQTATTVVEMIEQIIARMIEEMIEEMIAMMIVGAEEIEQTAMRVEVMIGVTAIIIGDDRTWKYMYNHI